VVLRVKDRNAVRGVAGALLLGALAFVLLVQYAPDSVAFSPNNYGWNGLQDVASEYNVNFTTSLSGLPTKAVLAILQPSVNYSSGDADLVRGFLLAGGKVLVADKSGVANSLLRGIGSNITIEEQVSIGDPVYNWKAESVPTALVLPGMASTDPFVANVSGLALNQPSPLLFSGSGPVQLAVTSQFSETQAGSRGPFAVMASEKVGAGTLVVVGDSQFLLNSEWTVADNSVLIGNLFGNGGVFIDASHWSASPLTSSTAQVKAGLRQAYASISSSPLRYVFATALVGLALALVPDGLTRRREDGSLLPRPIRATEEAG